MLIILYGDFSTSINHKQQRMIDGGCTCGYREYAQNFGHIIYMAPQKISKSWEHSITKPKNVLKFILQYPDSVVWSVKHSHKKDTEILSKIKNKKIYYSCNSDNMYNNFCNVSLVDTPKRIAKNAKIWFKGKDPNYWKSNNQKDYDYLLIGRRADKNEFYFINALDKINEKRKILWIGGEKHRNKINTKHKIDYTGFIGQDEVKNNIPKAKVGILFTELTIEGFPQSFLEMTMCGLPVVYNKNAPRNKFYFHDNNCLLCTKKEIVKSAEYLLKNHNSIECRKEAIQNYSIEKSYNRIISCIK